MAQGNLRINSQVPLRLCIMEKKFNVKRPDVRYVATKFFLDGDNIVACASLIDGLEQITLDEAADIVFVQDSTPAVEKHYDDHGRKTAIIRCQKPEEKTYQYNAEETARRLHMTDMTFIKADGKTVEIQY